MRAKRPEVASSVSKQIVVSLLVIALTTVISAQGGSLATGGDLQLQQPASAAVEQKPTVGDSELMAKSEPAKVSSEQAPIEPKKESVDAPAAGSEPSAKTSADAEQSAASEAGKRKGRAEVTTSAASDSSTSKDSKTSADKPAAAATSAAPEKPAAEKSKLETKTAAPSKASKPSSSSSAKSGSKSKLPANLGTVTSTGSGGPTHYMSKHDAYSAIAEKHGALAQDAMRKSDKRQLQGFGGIQKASGMGDMLSPFRGITDSGLARSLGASMRSIMKSKYSVPAYVASALLGAVALLAFYESPISPLPVPPLPEPPVGRFPPEMPNISPNTQVPFRPDMYQSAQGPYSNQRSFNGLGGLTAAYQQQQQQQPQAQQVLFPGSNNAQQRQMMGASATQQPGPVQQLAANLANLASAGKQQAAQRKSSPDYDQSSSRSFFGTTANISPKIGAPANQQQKQNSFLGFFGLGGASGSSSPSSGASGQSAAASGSAANSPSGDGSQLTGNSGSSTSSQAGSGSGSSSSLLEPKGQASNGLSNSHLVNKVKSYFSRAPAASASGSSSAAGVSNANSNPYDQYQRMSFVQALMKDTAFLPAFLAPNRKSSSASPSGSGSNKISSITSALSSATNPNPSARMQVDSQYGSGIVGQFVPTIAAQKQKPAGTSSSYGLVRAADRIAHAFLETFTSGMMQRSVAPSAESSESRKQTSDESMGHPSLTTSFLTDLMSSYGSSIAGGMESNQQQHQPSYDQQQAKSAASQQQSSQHQQQAGNPQQTGAQQSEAHTLLSGRSSSDSDDDHHSATPEQSKQASHGKQQQVAAGANADDNSQAHVRKTRSIGLEYPIESNHGLALREQQPSKASQINNVIDFVADSYTNNRLLFNFVMNQVGLSQAVPYVEQILASGGNDHHHH